MSVRVSKDHGIISQDLGAKTVVARLFADAKEDVTDGMTVIDMPTGYTLDAESYVITAAGDIGILDSNETWHWVGEDEDAPVSALSMSRPNLLGGFNPAAADTDDAEPVEETVEEEISDEDDMR